jgi:hypothetical protein
MQMKSTLSDLIGLVGVCSLTYGAWLAWHPAGFMLGGALALTGAYGARSLAKGGVR